MAKLYSSNMPHIHTEPGQYDHTASAYIIRTDFAEPKIMLHQHKLLKVWLQFGGHIELNENPWQAICHELREETGYDVSQLKVLQPPGRLKKVSNNTLHPIPVSYQTHQFGDTDHFHTDVAFLFITDQPPKHRLGKGESKTIQLFTAKELAALQEVLPDIKETLQFALDTCLSQWEAIDPSKFS